MKRTIFEDDHEALRASAREFLARECAPHNEEWEAAGQVDREIYKKAGDAGLLGFNIPEEFGGGGSEDFRFNAVVLLKQVGDRFRIFGNGALHLVDAVFDAFGDVDFAFTGQQLYGTHFTHVHAHRVGGAADIGLNGGEGGCSFFGCGFVGVGFGQQQGVRIRSTLEYVDPHVVDHADDVFHLFRIGNILRQVVVDLGVSQVTLLTATLDQLFEAGLLLRFSGHITLSTEGSGGLKTS